MIKYILIITVLIFGSWGIFSLASDNHTDGSHKKNEKHDEHEEHKEGETHTEGDEHAEKGHEEHKDEHGDEKHDENEEEEASSVVGPEKGIIEKGEAGFKLSPEAFSTMALKTSSYSGGNFALPSKAIVQVKTEKTVFRLRDGWIKRVGVEILKKNNDSLIISSSKFRSGDQIVTEGSGFLRIAEIFAEEGAELSHSH